MTEGSERERSLHGIVACIAAVMLPLAVYVGSYLALTQPIVIEDTSGRHPHGVWVQRIPSFRLGGRPAEVAYWPLTKIDMFVRPDHWGSLKMDPFIGGSPAPFASKTKYPDS